MLKRIVYFSPIPWSSFDQRPHFMVRHLLSHGVDEVLWLDPYPTRLPRVDDLRRLRRKSSPTARSESRISVCRVPALPIDPLPLGPALNRSLCWGSTMRRVEEFCHRGGAAVIVAKPSALVIALRRRLARVPFVFDALDDFPMFYTGRSREQMQRVEAEVVRASNLVLAASTKLTEKIAAVHGDVEHVPNGLDEHTIGAVRERQVVGQPLIGYVGTIASWFDWDLVVAIARLRPEMRITLVGPVYQQPATPLPSNIELVGQTSHIEACRWMQRFHVGLIPFRINELTAGVDPVKYYEYRACGLPIVSTAFGDMRLRGDEKGTWLLRQDTNLDDVLTQALRYQPSAQSLLAFRRANTWERRFKDSHHLERLLKSAPELVSRLGRYKETLKHESALVS